MTLKARATLAPGDVVYNHLGQPIFRVEAVHRARARGYVVVYGEPLRNIGSVSLAGHGQDLLRVEAAE